MLRRATIAAASLALLAAVAGPAHATFPGENGKLAVTQFTGILGIATVNPDGTALTALTEEPTSFGPAWSPDGNRIAFVRHVGPRSHIYVMDANGASLRLVRDTEDVVFEVAWSPDGEQLAFAARPNSGGDHAIWKLDVATGAAEKLFDPPDPDLAEHPDWSPDGDHLAFTLYRLELVCDDPDPEIADCFPVFRGDIHTVDRDGSDLRRLTSAGGEHPSWSPDGGRIAYSTSGGSINVMSATGAGHEILGIGVAPAWSPDGTKIGFGLQADVFVMQADGSGRTRILDGSEGGSPSYSAPVWQAIPNTPPDCSTVRADPSVLWPPNHKLRTVALSGAVDPDGDAVALRTTDATSNGPGGTAQLQGSSVLLRAERNPRGTTRVYTVTFTVTDAPGASCTGAVTVTVPGPKG